MKTFSKISAVFFLLSIFPTNSIGMGYPQDMFADQVTVRKVCNQAPAKKAGKARPESRQSACSSSVHGTCIQSDLPYQNQPREKQPAPDRRVPKNAVPSSRRISVNGVKLFLLSGKMEEEQGMQLEDYFSEEIGAE